ncbi:MAG: hypothetical protein V2A56_12330 [bacterium]
MRSHFLKRQFLKTLFPGRIRASARMPRVSYSRATIILKMFSTVAKLIITVLATTLFISCGLFTTRDPASPADTTPSADLALSSDEALTQLTAAISLHDPNLYLSVITDSFSYECTPQAYAAGATYFAGWSFNQESNFIRTLLSLSLIPADSLASLTLETIQQQEAADSTVTYQGYQLEVHTVRSGLPVVYEGIALFVVVRDVDGGWRIRRWKDDVSGEVPTMSQLRASL